MRQTITISLPDAVKRKLDRAVRDEHLNRSDIVREALRQYFALREFQSIRARMTVEAEKRGIFTDEDVFRLVS